MTTKASQNRCCKARSQTKVAGNASGACNQILALQKMSATDAFCVVVAVASAVVRHGLRKVVNQDALGSQVSSWVQLCTRCDGTA